MSFWLLFLHVMGACIWVGGHLYLVLKILPQAVREQNTQRILDFEGSFEKLGMSALVVQVLTGLYMAHLFLPDFSNLTDHSNPIAVLVSLKLTWLVLTIITALSAQLLMIPNVKKDINNAKLRNIFIGHTLMVTALAVAFVATGVMFRTGLPN